MRSNMAYECSSSFEDDRPTINFELAANARNDWLTAGKVIDGTLPRDAWPSDLSITVEDPQATQWDSFMNPGSGDVYSQRFVEAVGSGLADFSLLPCTLNGVPYVFLRCERPINCFDRQASRFKTYSADSPRILRIFHFAFTSALPEGAVLFRIPETLQLLATEAMAQKIATSGLRGVHLEPLP